MKCTLSVLAIAVALSGCATQKINEAKEKTKTQGELMKDIISKNEKFSPSMTSVRAVNSSWVAGRAYDLTERDRLPALFNQRVVFNQLEPVSFQEMVSMAADAARVRVVLSSDAIRHLYALDSGQNPLATSEAAAAPTPSTAAPLTDPNVPSQEDAAAKVKQMLDMGSQGLVGAKTKFVVSADGTVANLFDRVTSKANLFWRWEKDHILVYRHATETFVIDNLSGSTTMTAEIGSAQDSSSTGGGGTSATASSKRRIATNSSPESAWDNIRAALQATASPTARIVVSEYSGTVTVTDDPVSMEHVRAYVKKLNGLLSQRIAIRSEVYELTVDDSAEFSADLAALYAASTSPATTIGIGSVFTGDATALKNLTVSVVDPTSKWNGSKFFLNALNGVSNISLLTSSTNYTTNGQAVPVQVLEEKSYLAKVETTVDGTTGLAQTSLEPGMVSTGYSMMVLPKMTSSGDIMLHATVDLSSLDKIEEFSSGGSSIQLPEKSSKNFMQRLLVRPGQTLMMAGFERTANQSDVNSLTEPSLWFLGGSKKGGTRKVVTVILLTPYKVTN